MDITIILNYLIRGLSLGSVYAIIALGYTMVYGIAKMLNFAHGDVIMVGGYMAFCASSYLGWPAIPSILLAYELFGGVGLELIALGCGVCYMLSGTHGLYSSQLFVTEKLLSEYTANWGERLRHH